MDHATDPPPLVFTAPALRLDDAQAVLNNRSEFFLGAHGPARVTLAALFRVLLLTEGVLHVGQKPARCLWDVVDVALQHVFTTGPVIAAYEPLTAPQHLPAFTTGAEAEALDLTPMLPGYYK